jgi:hypothetical protein
VWFVSETKKIGSLLDLLPRENSNEWLALPPFVREEVSQLRKGHRPMTRAQLSESDALPKRVAHLDGEIRNISEQLADIRQAQRDFDEKAMPILQDLRSALSAHAARIDDHDKRLDGQEKRFAIHAEKLLRHETKHTEHDQHITGVFKRLVVLETTVAIAAAPKKLIKRRSKRRGKK